MATPSSTDDQGAAQVPPPEGTVPVDLTRRVVQFGRHVQNLPPGRHLIEVRVNKPGDLSWKIGHLTDR